MEYKTFVRRALLLPIVVPLAAGPALFVPGVEGTPAGDLVALVVWSLLFGGIPYLVFLAAFHLWMREKPEARVRRGLRLSPVFYSLFLAVCMALLEVARNGAAVDGKAFFPLAVFAGIALGFGYAYVLIAEAAWWVMRHRGAGRAPGTAALAAE